MKKSGRKSCGSNRAIKTLGSVHPYEVGKTGTRISTKQEYGGDAHNSGDDMDVSFDCSELNLSSYFKPISFEEDVTHDEWKESMQNEYDALMKNGN